MPTHSIRSSILVTNIDSSDDGAMLLDQRQNRLGAGEGELADAVHMGFDVLDRLPSQSAAGPLSQRNVEEFVIALKGCMVIPACRLALHLKKIVDPFAAL